MHIWLKDNQNRYQNVNINNYGQDKKVNIPIKKKSVWALKENAGQGFISNSNKREK
tara:strand:+ start:181 stop:348 length:168 start_codon:yes stop_codon:yes gene_type:complete